MISGIKPINTKAAKIILALAALLIVFGAGYYLAPPKITEKMYGLVTSQSYYDGTKADGAAIKVKGRGWTSDTVTVDHSYSIANPMLFAATTGPETIINTKDYATRMVIYSATVSLKVDNVEQAMSSVQTIIAKYQGITASASFSNSTGYVTIRVPQAAFYNAISDLEKFGKVQQRDIRGEDVTDQYVDLQAQLVNEQKQEERLQEILNLAKTVDDVMKVEVQLERVRGTIESLTGQIKYMTNRVELATITVNLYKESPLKEPKEWQPELNLSGPVKNGVQTLYSITEGMVTMAIVVLPFTALALIIYLVYRRIRPKSMVQSENLPQA